MPSTDLYLKALFGAAIPIDDICLVYPLTVKQIIGIGEEKYRQQLNLLTLTSYDLYEHYKKKGIEVSPDIDVYDNLMDSCENDGYFLLDMQEAFHTFIREQVQILSDLRIIVIGNGMEKRIMDKNKFFVFQNILRIQNRIPEVEEIPEDESPMQRKFRLRREAVKQAKKRQAEKESDKAVSFHDLISSLCCYNIGINLQNVGDLSIYAFHELLDRIQEKEKYDLDMRAILAGADAKKVKPKNWIRNLRE